MLENRSHPQPPAVTGWETHHTLLAQPEELLDLLGHQHLGTGHGSVDELQHWEGQGETGG